VSGAVRDFKELPFYVPSRTKGEAGIMLWFTKKELVISGSLRLEAL